VDRTTYLDDENKASPLTAADFIVLGSTVNDAVTAAIQWNTTIFVGAAVLIRGTVAMTGATRTQ